MYYFLGLGPFPFFPGRPATTHCGPCTTAASCTEAPYSRMHVRRARLFYCLLPSLSVAEAAPAEPPPLCALGGCGSNVPPARAPSSFLLSAWYREPLGIKAIGAIPHSFFLPASSPLSQVHRQPPHPPPPLVDCSSAQEITSPH
jgi:hypothetical protein